MSGRQKVAFGILCWDGDERRSNRYGAFFLDKKPFSGNAKVEPSYDKVWLQKHRGERVRIVVKIVESRVSGHAGDAGLKIRPPEEAPAVGTEIDLGVGILNMGPWPPDPDLATIILCPWDARDELWIDPRKLYTLHDQTVEVYAEVTTDDFTPAPELRCAEGAFDNGDGFSMQVKKRGPGIIPAKIERIGDGMFTLERPASIPGQFGRPMPYEERKGGKN